MTDLDSTQIIAADESLVETTPTIQSEATLKIISGTDSNTYEIGKETIIGRSNPSDLVIAAPSLSKQHAKITVNNGQFFITDLGSSNKTFQNKIQLQPNVCYALHDGDELKLGDIVCLFHERKEINKSTLPEPTYDTYMPPVNTLVEEDSPWSTDDDISPPPVVEGNVNVIPTTQTISDSYDDQEPTQPMKVWNGNANNTNTNVNNSSANVFMRASSKKSDDDVSKSNGVNDVSSAKSSTFIPAALSSILNDEDNDEDGLVIGASTLPAAVPVIVESAAASENENVEVISSSSETKTIDRDDENNEVTIATTSTTTTTTTTEVELDNTQAYTLEATDEQAPEHEHIVTDIIQTKREEVREIVIESDKVTEKITRTTITTKTTISENNDQPNDTQAYNLEPEKDEVQSENPVGDTQAYDLQPTTEDTSKTTMETSSSEAEAKPEEIKPEERDNPIMDTQVYDLEPQPHTDTATSVTDDEKNQLITDELVEDSSPRPASETFEVVPISKLVEEIENAESVADDTTPKQQIEVTINQDAIEQNNEIEQMETNEPEPEPTATVDESAKTTEIEAETETTPVADKQESTSKNEDETTSLTIAETTATDETDAKAQPTASEPEKTLDSSAMAVSVEPEEKLNESMPEASAEDALDTTDKQPEDDEEAEEETEETTATSSRPQRGMPRRAARRARGRRAGAAARARVVSTRLHGGRRNAIAPVPVDNESHNATLEETVNTEVEESPKKSTDTHKVVATPPVVESPAATQTNSGTNVRVSARIKARASSGRNRQFPYTDDYVDLDDLERHAKTPTTPVSAPPAPTKAAVAAATTTPTITPTRKSARGSRSASATTKRISLRQQPIDAVESPDQKKKRQKGAVVDVYEQMDTGGENEAPTPTKNAAASSRKRKSTTPVAITTTKRTRSATPQVTTPTSAPSTRRKPAPAVEKAPSPEPVVTPRRGRKSVKATTPVEQKVEQPIASSITVLSAATDRPVRIALSSHLNFDQHHLDTLRKLGFEIMDESCHVDALVVDRIRRTKKFFMCLARGAHILSPSWIEAMIKENRYLPYEKYYLEDTNAETRYGFQLRESVRLAKQQPIFKNYKIFCTKDTSPPYDDLKDIIEAAGGKFIDKINVNKPGKDLVCIVAQSHKSEYENLFKKGVPIVSEEFALSGISKQKLDFDAFTLFPNTAVKMAGK